VRGQGGKREIPASEFFVGGFKTSLQPGELLEEISIPAAAGKQGYYKFKLCESSWPIATGTCVLGGDGGARITLGAVNARPVSVEVSGSDPAEAARAAEGAVTEPWTDTLADGEYRKMIAGVIAKRALAAAEGGVGQ
jgi:carbon-monoxide dehydrogenase medium subunit